MRTFVAIVILACGVGAVRAQFRASGNSDTPESTLEAMSGHNQNLLGGLFDPMRFSMHQSYTFSFIGGSAGSVGLGMFTNTFSYRPSDNLFISADVSAVYSPFSSFGSAFQKSLNGIYLTNARLDWKMGDNTFLRVQYVGSPYSGNDYSDPFYSEFPRYR